MTDCKYKLIIFNYNEDGNAPELIFADKYNKESCHTDEGIYIGITKEVLRHWEDGTWWFKEKEYGLHTFELDDWSKFYEELKNYE